MPRRPSSNLLRIETAQPAQWLRCYPLHPARECAFQVDRGAYFCGRCGALYDADGKLIERQTVTLIEAPTASSALAWALAKPVGAS